jgi:transposase InsO family protein
VKSKWEYREEAEQLDQAIKTLDENIREMKKQNNNSQSSQSSQPSELNELYTKVSALRDARRDYAKVLGYGLVFKGIRERLASELHSPIVRKFTRRSVFINALDDTWSADLIFLPNKDEGYKGMLTVIDCFSKYGWAIPVKSKTNKELVEAFKTIFKTSSRKPKRLWTDRGKEFYGVDFRAFLTRNNIKLYSTESELKAVIIERWNRTLKEKMYRKFTELTTDAATDAATDADSSGSQQWLHLIPTIVDEYNNTTHSSHKMTPVEASKPENESVVKQRLHAKMKKYTSKPPKFAVGDKVRIYSYKYTFDKGYKKNYTDEVFEVSTVHPTVPWTYSISDSSGEQIQGKFYNEEMIHSEFDFGNRLQKNKVYVIG